MLIAGIDEAGRGPLFGPVSVAAVILPDDFSLPGLTDSKKISEKKRELLFDQIIQQALCYEIVFVSVEDIDRYNILQATLIGMRDIAFKLSIKPDKVLIDGNKVPEGMPCPSVAVVGGDLSKACISAASILAKVSRDRWVKEMDARYPGYGLAQHKGYPTKVHLEALQRLGPTPEHRKSFGPVKRALEATI